MTTPTERTHALQQTRAFLAKLCDSVSTPDVPASIRNIARQLLRHYPEPGTVDVTATVLPHWWAAEGEPDGTAVPYLELLGLATELSGGRDVAVLAEARRATARLPAVGNDAE